MAFRPFGDPVDIRSPLSVDAARAALRSGLRPMFDRQRGARGWMLGRLLCLWHDPYDRRGPMLLAWMRNDGFGARIMGRAGSDLNGTLLLVLWVMVIVGMVLVHGPPDRGVWPMTALIVAILALVMWFAHRDRREADPLVRFVQRTLAKKAANDAVPLSGLTLEIDGVRTDEPVTTARLTNALAELGPHGTVVLAFADQVYIQTLMIDGLFVIEKRDGDGGRHFEIVWDTTLPKRQPVSFDVALAVFLAHVRNDDPPAGYVWRRLDVGMPSNLLSSFG